MYTSNYTYMHEENMFSFLFAQLVPSLAQCIILLRLNQMM